MSLIHVVQVDSQIQHYLVNSTIYMESPILFSKEIVELAALIHLWNKTNCLITHSNQNSLSSLENYKELAKAFHCNGEIEVSGEGEYTASINNILSLSAQNSEKLRTIHEFDEISIEETYKDLFNFSKAIGLSEKFIQTVDIGNEQFVSALIFFHEKLNDHHELKVEWLSELDELIRLPTFTQSI